MSDMSRPETSLDNDPVVRQQGEAIRRVYNNAEKMAGEVSFVKQDEARRTIEESLRDKGLVGAEGNVERARMIVHKWNTEQQRDGYQDEVTMAKALWCAREIQRELDRGYKKRFQLPDVGVVRRAAFVMNGEQGLSRADDLPAEAVDFLRHIGADRVVEEYEKDRQIISARQGWGIIASALEKRGVISSKDGYFGGIERSLPDGEVKEGLGELGSRLRRLRLREAWSEKRSQDEVEAIESAVPGLVARGADFKVVDALRRRVARLRGESYGEGEEEGLLPGERQCAHCGSVRGAGEGNCPGCSAQNSENLKITPEEYAAATIAPNGRFRVGDVYSVRRIDRYGNPEVRGLADEVNSLVVVGEEADDIRGHLVDFRTRAAKLRNTEGQSDMVAGINGLLRAIDISRKRRSARETVGEEVTEKPQGEVIPKDEVGLRLFIRRKVIDYIRVVEKPELLDLQTVSNELAKRLGVDMKNFRPIDLYPEELGDRRVEVRELVEDEIRARCLLRIAEIQEQGYKQMGDRGKAIERYIAEVKGSEANPSKAVFLSRDVYVWLQNLEDIGDKLTTETVDHAFQLLVLMGENDPGLLTGNLSRFRRYIQVLPNGADPMKVDSYKNLYDPSYPEDLKQEFFKEAEAICGRDAVNLAWQLFQAFKEEGNYNWQHYMNRLFAFGKSRHILATVLQPPVYTGSRRVYVKEERETFPDEYYDDDGKRKRRNYLDQLGRLALSPLRTRVKTGSVEVVEAGERKNKDVKKRDEFLKRAMRGRFLADTQFGSVSWVAELPQQSAFLTIEKGHELRGKIVDIGKLGEAEDKGAEVGKAVGLLADVRRIGVVMAMEAETDGGMGVFTVEELDRQVVIEARDIWWEMSVDNPVNIEDINLQKRDRPKFLTPSQISILFEKMGGFAISGGMRIMGSDEDYTDLGVWVKSLRERSYKWFDSRFMIGLEDADADLSLKRRERMELRKVLPRQRGGRVMTSDQASLEETINRAEQFKDKWGRRLWGNRWKEY
jgi:hypothetical protein